MPVLMASQSALILSHPLSSRFPSNRTTLSFHTFSSLSLHRPKSKFFQSSSLTRSTRTVTPLSPSKLVASKISPLSLLKPSNTLSTAAAGPLFFAPISSNGSAPGTPIAVIAAGLASRCLEIYGRVLLIRILLSLYPNMEWDKQPMSAIRDLCDPFLGLFRGIIPPLFNSVDVSPILAFLLLGMLAQFAKSPGISL